MKRKIIVAGIAAMAATVMAVAQQATQEAKIEIKETVMGNSGQALAVAHRGFRGIAPENTLLAARLGLEAGADLWELDVAATSDGELIVIHDDSLARTTDAKARFPARNPWTVYDFTLAEVRSLDAGSWYAKADPFGQIKAGVVGAAELASFAGIRIPTLREALEFTRDAGWKVNIEIKDATGYPCDAWIVERTMAMVRELGLVDRVLLSSFNHDYIRRSKKAEPSIPTGALVEKVPSDPVALLKETGAASLNPGLKGLREETVRKVREAGFGVMVWTVNEVADMKKVLSWGATGLFTDFPNRLLELQGRK
ncbi:MAG: glycerophosphodiester phosphodiesterase family protein [Spirochaetaceae bacterium]|nr:glycerophosphodiester phosphodiesterase family protein [Spirochaetaceae bacterium]